MLTLCMGGKLVQEGTPGTSRAVTGHFCNVRTPFHLSKAAIMPSLLLWRETSSLPPKAIRHSSILEKMVWNNLSQGLSIRDAETWETCGKLSSNNSGEWTFISPSTWYFTLFIHAVESEGFSYIDWLNSPQIFSLNECSFDYYWI